MNDTSRVLQRWCALLGAVSAHADGFVVGDNDDDSVLFAHHDVDDLRSLFATVVDDPDSLRGNGLFGLVHGPDATQACFWDGNDLLPAGLRHRLLQLAIGELPMSMVDLHSTATDQELCVSGIVLGWEDDNIVIVAAVELTWPLAEPRSVHVLGRGYTAPACVLLVVGDDDPSVLWAIEDPAELAPDHIADHRAVDDLVDHLRQGLPAAALAERAQVAPGSVDDLGATPFPIASILTDEGIDLSDGVAMLEQSVDANGNINLRGLRDGTRVGVADGDPVARSLLRLLSGAAMFHALRTQLSDATWGLHIMVDGNGADRVLAVHPNRGGWIISISGSDHAIVEHIGGATSVVTAGDETDSGDALAAAIAAALQA